MKKELMKKTSNIHNLLTCGLRCLKIGLHPKTLFSKLRNPGKCWHRLNYQLQKDRYPKKPKYLPLHIDLELSTNCNQKCIMCFRSFDRFNGRKDSIPAQFHDHNTNPEFVDMEFVKKLVPYLKLADCVNTLGQGEVLLHPQLNDILKLLQQEGVTVNIQTNGILLTPEKLEFFLDCGVEGIMVSVHGNSSNTIKQISPGLDLDSLHNNLKYLRKLKSTRQTQSPVLGFYYVVMKSNLEELPGLVERAAQLDGKFVVISHLIKFGKNIWHESLENSADEFDRIYKKTANLAEKHGIQLHFSYRKDYEKTGGICTDPWTTVHIHANGDVTPCGFSTRKMGNLNENTLQEIWNGENYFKLRSRMYARSKLPECESCLCFSPTSGPDNMVPAYNEFLNPPLSLKNAGYK